MWVCSGGIDDSFQSAFVGSTSHKDRIITESPITKTYSRSGSVPVQSCGLEGWKDQPGHGPPRRQPVYIGIRVPKSVFRRAPLRRGTGRDGAGRGRAADPPAAGPPVTNADMGSADGGRARWRLVRSRAARSDWRRPGRYLRPDLTSSLSRPAAPGYSRLLRAPHWSLLSSMDR